MARPKGIWTPELVRQRIQTTKLVQRLEKHAHGEVEMTQTQVRAAEILLSKTLPSLTSTDLNLDGQLGTYDVSDKPLTPEQWAAQAEDYLGSTRGTAGPTN